MSDARPGIADRAGAALEPRKSPTMAKMIEDQTASVERALPAHLKGNADAYIRAAQTLVKQTPKLAQCDPMTVLGGILTASSLGLELTPTLGHCYLIPYGTKAQFIIGFRGLIDLAWRSGKMRSIEAHTVHANDTFEYEYGLEPKLVHKPALENPGHAICYYCVAHFKDGGYYFLVMSKDEIEDHRKRSKSKDSGPWVTDYDAMARKTCVRAAAPYLPLTTSILRDIARDETVATGTEASNLEVERPDFDADTGEVFDAEVVE